ncbi:MAG: EAL domain-containing protein [Erysipelotrichaceae bacterium]|nr:EAL domain-containing protein [Erysipelotrichaceae bacterium]
MSYNTDSRSFLKFFSLDRAIALITIVFYGNDFNHIAIIAGSEIFHQLFVSNIEHSKKDSQLVELIISIAKKLNVLVVAEGAETKEQLSKLKEMGCEIVQGYCFSRPVTADEFEKPLLKDHTIKIRRFK